MDDGILNLFLGCACLGIAAAIAVVIQEARPLVVSLLSAMVSFGLLSLSVGIVNGVAYKVSKMKP